MESSQEGVQVKLKSPPEKPLKQHVLILEHLLEGAQLQWKEASNELERVRAEEKMTRDGRSSAFLASKMELVRSKAKLECLVERMKSVQDKGKLESRRWKMRLSKNIEKAEFALQEMKWMPEEEGVEALGLDIMQVEEQIAKSKLLLEEMELIQDVKKGKFPSRLYFQKKMSPMLTMQLKEHMVKVESLLENMKEESRIDSPMLRIQLKEDKLELESLLNEMKLVEKSGKVRSSTLTLRMEFEVYMMKLKLLLDGTELEEEKEGLGSGMLEKPSSRKLIAKSEFFPKQGEKEGLGSPMLEKPLSGELVTKSEFFPKQGEKEGLGSPMLEKPSSGELVTKSEFFPKQGEKEGLGSPMLEKPLSEKFIAKSEFFPKQGEKGLRSEMLEKPLSGELITKSEFFPKQGEKEGLASQMLEKALLEELIEKSRKLIMKSKLVPEQELIFVHLRIISRILLKIKSVQDESYLKSPVLGMRYKERIVELEDKLKKMELEIVQDQLRFRKLKIMSYSQRVELEGLLEKTKIELKEGLQSQALKIELNEDITKLELSLEETEFEERHVAELKRFIAKTKKIYLVREERTMESLKLQVKERTVELKSLLEEMKLMLWFEKTWYRNWETYVGEMESLLKGMELKQIGQGLPSQAFEIQLNEHIVKLEILVKEIESTRDVKILELKGHLGKLKSLLEATKLERDEKLEMQLKELITQIKFQRETEKIRGLLTMQLEEHTEELTSLREKIKCVQLAGELECKPLEMELDSHKGELESLLDKMNSEGWLHMSEEELQKNEREWKSLLNKIESKPDVEILSILMLKMELEGHSAKWRYLLDELMKLGKERKLISTMLRDEMKQHIAKLRPLIVEMKLEQKEKTVGSGTLQMELEEHIVKSELLLETRELICDVIILKSTMSKIQFKERLTKVEFDLLAMELGRNKRKLKFSALEEDIVKLNSLLEEMKSKEKEVKLESSTIELEHEEGKLEYLAEGRQFTPREQKATSSLVAQQKGVKLESSTVQVKLEECIVKLEALLEKMKLEPKEEKLEPSRKRIPLEQEEGKMESSTPREQKATSPLIAQRPIIIIDGRGQDGQSLTSVEGYIFLEGRWIELPAMNTPRSFMSSVVIGNEIVVSGGDTGDAITDTIEVLNLAETPLQWRLSPARLPVPLSAHQTVVFEGKLIVIGGHDFNKGRNSNKIYEVLLTPPYTSRILRTLVTPVAWHGAELVGHEIFIFGGGRTPAVPSSAVFSYSPGSDRLHDERPLPSAVMGMATASKGRRVAVIGGLDDNEQELNEVFTYPIRAGGVHALPQMNERRGGCSAVISHTLERGGSCSSEIFTDALFALGSVRSVNTVEGYSFESHRWIDMPPMREPRGFCSMVVAPIEFQYE